jgi:hypothetical protein
LVAARWLQSEGFAPVLFEQAASRGGQWSGDACCSGVWPSMRTNTSRVLTQFSDLPHAPGLAVYPSKREIGEYLLRYAARYVLLAHIRLRTAVREIRAVPGGYAVRHGEQEEVFEKVVVARWLAYAWSGAIAAPTPEEMRLGLDACRARGGEPQKTKMNLIALSFARAAGVEPEPQRWPELRRALLFGPLAPVSFRLQGRDALPDAAARFAGEAMASGCVQSPEFCASELQKLQQLGLSELQ